MAPKTPATKKAIDAKKAVVKGIHSQKVTKVRTSATFRRPKTLQLPRAPKYQRKSIAHAPRLDQFKVILRSIQNDTAIEKYEGLNTLVLLVDIKANKRQIKDAVKKVFFADTIKINTLITPKGEKKAFVRLSSDADLLDIGHRAGIF
ncbi:60S ribosomal protein uL23 [Dipodascopsis tothii]|uniref:60S ribosomal protein uL23 n=1 Tax=Dipodascopsis tothii TaxID=44089 RepID=UPI0034CDDCFC